MSATPPPPKLEDLLVDDNKINKAPSNIIPAQSENTTTTNHAPDAVSASASISVREESSSDQLVMSDDDTSKKYKEDMTPYESLDIIKIDLKSSILYKENRPFWLNALGVLALIPFGLLEGYGFFSCGMADPAAFRGQFTLSAWIILKLFIAAVGLSMVVFALFELLVPSFWYRKSDSRNNKVGFFRAAIGGAFTGVGMALSSTGSTMLPSMLGGGVKNAWAMVVGFFAGALIFAIFEKLFLKDYLAQSAVCHPGKDKLTLDEKMGIRFHKIGLPVGLGMFGFACVLEWTVPGMKRSDDTEKLSMGALAWPAIAGGAVVALNQAVLLIIGNHQQGGSTSLMSVVSFFSWGHLAPEAFPKWGVHINQFVMVWIGTTLGALIGRETTDSNTHAPEYEVPIWRCVVGGFVAVFAARFSDSCACGGLTSIGAMSFEGVVLAVCMFGCAIATGFVIKEAGG